MTKKLRELVYCFLLAEAFLTRLIVLATPWMPTLMSLWRLLVCWSTQNYNIKITFVLGCSFKGTVCSLGRAKSNHRIIHIDRQ
jgi:hypothetical protein